MRACERLVITVGATVRNRSSALPASHLILVKAQPGRIRAKDRKDERGGAIDVTCGGQVSSRGWFRRLG